MYIKIQNLKKSIAKNEILKGINLNIEKGDVFGLIGPNGAGKSTLIKILASLSSMTSGDISIGNYKTQNRYIRTRGIVGALIETPTAYPHLTGFENMKIIANMFNLIDDNMIDKIFNIIGLNENRNNKYNTYSLGMKQRLGIGFAIINKPDVLLLDEPMNGLDVEGIEEIRNLIKTLSDEGVTIIISSHIMSEMDKICNKAAFIYGGKVIDIVNSDEKNFLGYEKIYNEIIRGRENELLKKRIKKSFEYKSNTYIFICTLFMEYILYFFKSFCKFK